MVITEQQSLAIINATRPLQPQERISFMTALETLLAGRHEIGDGELFRALRDLQRKISSTAGPDGMELRPPQLAEPDGFDVEQLVAKLLAKRADRPCGMAQ